MIDCVIHVASICDRVTHQLSNCKQNRYADGIRAYFEEEPKKNGIKVQTDGVVQDVRSTHAKECTYEQL